jgi:regulation of enolase protein 1 (concanavalin A-like superfamily)
MDSTRRSFIQQAAATALATGWAVRAHAGADDLLEQMTWLNPPAAAHIRGAQITVRSKPKTDFWRKTFYGYITDNGHFFHLPMEGDFRFEARVNGNYGAQYDQAGLMVRLDEQHWVKCGVELVDGKPTAGVVFTRDFSDWSTLLDASKEVPTWWRIVRTKDAIETQCSVDGKTFAVIRQGYFPPRVPVNVGIMCAAPEGDGFDAVFDELKLEKA